MKVTAKDEMIGCWHKYYPSHTISQEKYSIWSWFLVHLHKMIISPEDFFVFSKFWFFWFLRGKSPKRCPKWQKVVSMMMMMMMMNCFCGIVDWRKAFSLISSRDHYQRSSPSRISDTPWAGFEPVQNLSLSFVEWSCVVVITITPQCQNPRSISQEPCIIWLSFMVHICKMIISPVVSFILSKFWFFGFLGG